jgi:hypothetical protein
MKHALTLFISTLAACAFAQYSIDWHKVAGGGGTGSNGVYVISSTIGQHDASGTMTGGRYSVTGGFWSLYAFQTPGAPLLTITNAGNQVIVSWPVSVTGWTLQTNSNFATGTRRVLNRLAVPAVIRAIALPLSRCSPSASRLSLARRRLARV